MHAWLRSSWFRRGAGLLLALLAMGLVPWLWCARHHAAFWDHGEQAALARHVAKWTDRSLEREDFHTGSALFDGEWLFGTYMMAAMGFGQYALQHPGQRDWALPRMESCIDRLLSPELRAFDAERWGHDALDTLAQRTRADHAAYLGYFNLVLSLHRSLQPDARFAALNDRITDALAARVAARPFLLLETYPGETYPVDNCSVIASIRLHGRATGTDREALLADWASMFRKHFIDPKTGLMIQAVDGRTGKAIDAPRGSGTSLGLYFLSFSHPELSADLYQAMRTELYDRFIGFGGFREYPRGTFGLGDIDSGPVVLGFSTSATGFGLAGARQQGDRAAFRRLFATAWLAGAPRRNGEGFEFTSGGPLGNAILFAMLTALPAEGSRP